MRSLKVYTDQYHVTVNQERRILIAWCLVPFTTSLHYLGGTHVAVFWSEHLWENFCVDLILSWDLLPNHTSLWISIITNSIVIHPSIQAETQLLLNSSFTHVHTHPKYLISNKFLLALLHFSWLHLPLPTVFAISLIQKTSISLMTSWKKIASFFPSFLL